MSLEIVVGLLGLLAGLVGNFISGAYSFISMSALLALGLPPYLSLSTYHFGGIGFAIGGIFKYLKNGNIIWKYVVSTTILSIIGVYLGTKIVLQINEEVLTTIMGILILLLVPLTLWKRNLGVVKKEVSKIKEYFGYVTYLLSKIWYGIFPMGFGVIVSYIYLYFWGMTILDMKGTSRIAGIASSVTALSVFLLGGIVNWKLGIIFFCTTYIGSYIGAHYTIKAGNKILQYLLILTTLLLAIKAIFF